MTSSTAEACRFCQATLTDKNCTILPTSKLCDLCFQHKTPQDIAAGPPPLAQAPVAEVPRHDPASVAEAFHEAYERLAPDFGYKTREESAKPWAEVPDQNKKLMEAVVNDLMVRGIVVPGSREGEKA